MFNRKWSYNLKDSHLRQGLLTLAAVCAAVCIACGTPKPTPPPPAMEETPSAALTALPPAPPAFPAASPTQAEPVPPASPSPVGPETAADDPPAAASFIPYAGPQILEERILFADIIARVRLHSVGLADVTHDDKGVECAFNGHMGWRPKPIDLNVSETRIFTSGYYTEGVAYTFDVIEYLKGSGDDRLSALDPYWSRQPPECRERFGTEQEAIAAAAPELEEGRRDTSIEGREAIIFLVANQHPEDSAYAYELMLADPYRGSYDPYVPSQPAWMPGAEVTSGEPVHGEAAGSLIFKSATPDTRATETAAPSTLAELRTLVAEVVEDFTTGAAEHGETLYRDCLALKYYLVQVARWGLKYNRRDYDIESGLPVGSQIIDPEIWAGTRSNPPIEYMGGRDAHLFNTDPAMFHTERPLPQGEYRFYYWAAPFAWMTICGADEVLEPMKTAREDFVHVTAPEGVLHEAFFDPVASGDAVGAGSADGVLKPAAFTVNGSQTTIRRIEWESGRVVMRLEPDDNALADHHVDFIALDGSVALRLDFDDAAEATNGGAPALVWGVCNQPWSDGDLLMLRLRESEANLTGATGDADCPATPPARPPAVEDTATTTISAKPAR